MDYVCPNTFCATAYLCIKILRYRILNLKTPTPDSIPQKCIYIDVDRVEMGLNRSDPIIYLDQVEILSYLRESKNLKI